MKYKFEKTNKIKIINKLLKVSSIEYDITKINDSTFNIVLIKEESNNLGFIIYKYNESSINFELVCINPKYNDLNLEEQLVKYIINSTKQFNYSYTSSSLKVQKIINSI